MRAPAGRSLTLRAADGRQLEATCYGESAEHFVVLAGATGVPQRYYGRFAGWLAGRGATVLTFDYRGVGGSRSGPVREDRATMAEWGRLDLDAALQHALGVPAGRRVLLGHSFGGSGLALAPGAHRLDGAALVAVQLGDARLWPPSTLPSVQGFWQHTLPAVVAEQGHLPSPLGLGEDLPPGVALQWARWATWPGGFLRLEPGTREALARLTFPVTLYSLSDDRTFAPWAAAEALRLALGSAATCHRVITPEAVGAPAIGHFGAFRPAFRDTIWPRLADSLLAPTSAPTPGAARASG